jgi:hypothetical protein
MLASVARGRYPVRLLGVVTGALGWLATSGLRVASACPACAGSDGRNIAFLKIGSLFVLVPFLVVGLVLYVLRQAPERTSAPLLRKTSAPWPPPR